MPGLLLPFAALLRWAPVLRPTRGPKRYPVHHGAAQNGPWNTMFLEGPLLGSISADRRPCPSHAALCRAPPRCSGELRQGLGALLALRRAAGEVPQAERHQVQPDQDVRGAHRGRHAFNSGDGEPNPRLRREQGDCLPRLRAQLLPRAPAGEGPAGLEDHRGARAHEVRKRR
ncbi:unnamed protein product, partial [Effrenium voratum]